MKTRSGFVSNSSSTSFIFVTKADATKEFFEEIARRPEFNLTSHIFGDTFRTCSSKDVAAAMRASRIGFVEIQEYLAGFRSDLLENSAAWQQYSEKQKRDEWWARYLTEEKLTIEKNIAKFEELVKAGFKFVYEIGFGDNHGEICGGDIGDIMDYEGRSVKIDDENLFLMTEQNR